MCDSMSPTEYKAALALVGLSVSAAARFLDMSERQLYRFGSGICVIPTPIARLLRLMVENKINASNVAD